MSGLQLLMLTLPPLPLLLLLLRLLLRLLLWRLLWRLLLLGEIVEAVAIPLSASASTSLATAENLLELLLLLQLQGKMSLHLLLAPWWRLLLFCFQAEKSRLFSSPPTLFFLFTRFFLFSFALHTMGSSCFCCHSSPSVWSQKQALPMSPSPRTP